MYVISADGGEAQQLTKVDNDVNALDWAPDSKRIAFSMSDPDPKALKDRKEKYGDFEIVTGDYSMMNLWIVKVPAEIPADPTKCSTELIPAVIHDPIRI